MKYDPIPLNNSNDITMEEIQHKVTHSSTTVVHNRRYRRYEFRTFVFALVHVFR